MDTVKETAKTAAAEVAAAYGWGMVLLVCVLLAFVLLCIYGAWQVARWAKPKAEQFINSAVGTMEKNAQTLEKQCETLDKLTDSLPAHCKAHECRWVPPPSQQPDLPGLRGSHG